MAASTDQPSQQDYETKQAQVQPDTDAPQPLYKQIFSQFRALFFPSTRSKRTFTPLPSTTQARLDASLNDVPIDTKKLVDADLPAVQEKEKTILYLAYGSNLCDETFRGVRGIRPLSQLNVLVPSLRLTFDLPGIPYSEPCFANSARRTPESSSGDATPPAQPYDYHKDRWHKGMVGVVYEVTLKDYAHIIATEGGGSAYHDILIDCYALPPSDTVPSVPTSPPFKAHTLFAPADDERPSVRASRPDPSYAQPSARYLKLITDGAIERKLPTEYLEYVQDIRAYTITTKRQATGKVVFLAIWMPFIVFIMTLSRAMQDKKGRAPKWVGFLSSMLFKGMWVSYDLIFKRLFGDGERTVGDKAARKRFDLEVGVDSTEREALLEEAAIVLDDRS